MSLFLTIADSFLQYYSMLYICCMDLFLFAPELNFYHFYFKTC